MRLEVTLTKDDMRHSTGQCWIIQLPAGLALGDSPAFPTRSELELHEDGVLLGPSHATHSRIRTIGHGLYSHWRDNLYFSTSDGTDPTANGRIYTVTALRSFAGEDRSDERGTSGSVAFPRLSAVAEELRRGNRFGSLDLIYDPGKDAENRIKILEAKVEYLLDELYCTKSMLRHLTSTSSPLNDIRKHQLATFDFQWKNLPYQDNFLSNPEWRGKAVTDVCHRLEKEAEWLKGKRILDCGCGPGRYAWAFSTAGAAVTAFDMSDNGLADARTACAEFPDITIEKRNILDPLPYPKDFDLVWCYGVIHCTGDTYRALSNIASHVKPGGLLYFMVYAEPDRGNREGYEYYHEIYAMRQLTQNLSFAEKADFFRRNFGERYALGCFNSISSVINDLYTFEECVDMLKSLGFDNIRRTAMDEFNLNIVATRDNIPGDNG